MLPVVIELAVDQRYFSGHRCPTQRARDRM